MAAPRMARTASQAKVQLGLQWLAPAGLDGSTRGSVGGCSAPATHKDGTSNVLTDVTLCK